MVPRLSLLDNILSLLVCALVHALHHVFDLLQLQPLQVLVLVQGVCQQLFYTVHTQEERNRDFCRGISEGCSHVGQIHALNLRAFSSVLYSVYLQLKTDTTFNVDCKVSICWPMDQ